MKKMANLLQYGETGLDYHFNYSRELQIEYFKKHIQLANEMNLPIIIHAREAHCDVYNILKEYEVNKKGIMHCYSGNLDFMKKFVQLGFYISFGGSITKSDKYDNIIKETPIDRIIIETDAPLMPPIQLGKGARNESKYLRYVIEKISKIKEVNPTELEKIFFKNACDIYNIKLLES